MWTVASYVLSQKLRRTQALPARADARAAVPLQPGLRRLRQDPVPRAHPQEAAHPRRMLPRRRGMRRARWSASPAASRCCTRRSPRSSTAWSRARNTSTCAPTRCCSSRRLDLFQPSKYLTLQRPPRRAAGTPRSLRLPEGGYETAVEGDQGCAVQRGFRVTTNTTLFDGADPDQRPRVLRRDDAAGRRGHDALARLLLRESPRPAALPRPRPHPPPVPRHARQPQETLALQPVAALPRVPHGQARVRVHALGHARPTTSSAGRSPATCCRTAMRRPSPS